MHVQPFRCLKIIYIKSELSNEYASIRAADVYGFRPADLSRILLKPIQNMPKTAISAQYKGLTSDNDSGIKVQ